MKRREYLISAGVLTTSTAIAGCSGDDNNDSSPEATDSEEQEEDSEQEEDGEQEENSDPAEFVVKSIDAPEAAELNEEFSVTIRVENVGEEDGTWSGEFEYNRPFGPSPGEQWTEDSIFESIAAGEVVEIERDFEYTEPGFLYYRLPGENDIGEVEIPGDRAPIVTDAALVSEWDNFGDIENNRIETATTNDSIHVAYRQWQFVHEGTLAGSEQAEIYDDDGDRIALEDYEGEQITDGNGWSQWERAFFFSTDGWEPGEYTAEIIARDDVTQDVSESFRFEFEVTSEE